MKNFDPNLDFRRLKEQVSLAAVLLYYDLAKGLRLHGETLRGPCPLHGGNNPFAFNAHLAKNLWNCFTHCGGGDVITLARIQEGGSYANAAKVLQRLAQTSPSFQSPFPKPVLQPFQPFTRCLVLNPCSPFLQEVKGISIETARFFEAGISYTSTFLRGMVAVRLFDLQGHPLGYTGRRLDSDSIARCGKWRFPKGFPKHEVLFNAHRAAAFLKGGLVVVECPWAVARLHQAGVPNAVALLGTTVSDTQAQWLSQAERIVALFDGDRAGMKASVELSEALETTTDVQLVDLPWGTEPEDLSDKDLRETVSELLPTL